MMLDDVAIFAAVVQQGGFSHAAKYLGISNGLVSRRVAHLEEKLGVSLIKRTTRRIHLTPEGELFWQHAQRIQQELESALTLIQGLAEKPKGHIRISATLHFGRSVLMPIISEFLDNFSDIKIDLILTNQVLDINAEKLDLAIRGSGYRSDALTKDSTLIARKLMTMKIGLYASKDYIVRHGEPKTADELRDRVIIGYVDQLRLPNSEVWLYQDKGQPQSIELAPKFKCNDLECGLLACQDGYGIGRFGELAVKEAVRAKRVRPILTQYDWGKTAMYAVYAQQQALPKRTRMLLDFIIAKTSNLCAKMDCL